MLWLKGVTFLLRSAFLPVRELKWTLDVTE